MADAGISTLGVQFGYAVETTVGKKPTTFKQLTRINSIPGITIEPEQIDASALEDKVTRYVKGRADTGGAIAVVVNITTDTVKEWEELISAYQAATGGLRMWFQSYVPGLNKSFFFVAQPPELIPEPEFTQNELLTVEMNLTIEEYIGLGDAVTLPVEAASGE